MVRTQLYVSVYQHQRLQHDAKIEDVTMSEIMRQALKAYFEKKDKATLKQNVVYRQPTNKGLAIVEE